MADRQHDRHRLRHPYRWVIFGAMYAVYFAFGMLLLAIPPMISEVRADLGAGRDSMGVALGAWALVYIGTAPPAGRLIDRIGLRRSLTAGSLLIAVSALVQAAAQGIATLWLAVAIIGFGGPLVSLSAPKLVTVWFSDAAERPMAVGFYTSAPALGGVCSLAATHPLLLPAFGDWRGVLVFDAALGLAAALVWMVVSSRAPDEAVALGGRSEVAVSGRAAASTLLASSGVRLAMVLGAGAFFVTQALAAWLPDMLEQHSGLSTGAAANWAAASLAVGMVARFGVSGLASGRRRSAMLHATMATLIVAMVAMAVGPRSVGVAAAVVLGLRSLFNALVVIVLMETDEVTAGNAGLAYGLWFSAVEVGGALGPVVVGWFGDSEVGFPGALWAMGAVLAVLMGVLFGHEHRHRLP